MATYIQLGNKNDNNQDVASFEEAFGEYSNAKGRGAARRQERIANRTETKVARQEAKGAVQAARSERKSDKRVARQENRGAKQEAKHARKTANVGARGGKRLVRKDFRMQRRELGKPTPKEVQPQYEEPLYEEPVTSQEQAEEEQPMTDTPYASQEESSNAPTEQEYSQEDTATYKKPQYEETADEYSSDWDSENEGQEEEQDSSFEGEDESSNVDGAPIVIEPIVKDKTLKIEWHKENISRLKEAERTANDSDREDEAKDFRNEIEASKKRIAELEGSLSNFVNFEGEFSNADGLNDEDFYEARGCRKKQVAKGPRLALGTRNKIRKNKKNAQRKFTNVRRGLGASIGRNKIVVPASSADGTGLNALDLQDDFDSPSATLVEMKSNADGKKKINWKAIGIGAAVAVVIGVSYYIYKRNNK